MVSASENSDDNTGSASDMDAEEFRACGHALVDALADFYDSLPSRPVTPGESADELRRVFARRALPETGQTATDLIAEVAPLLFEHSLHNGHPRFFSYITSSAAPLGALADLLAAGINQNCGLRHTAPAANEIEQQAVTWLAELIGYPTPCGGIMVSGGNVANLLGFLAARAARLDWNVREGGVAAGNRKPRCYCSKETHTWIQKAADVSGLGTESLRWIETDADGRMRSDALQQAIEHDLAAGDLPFLVVGTAGQVSTGAIDPLPDIAAIAARHNLWFHVDGAYGAPAACLPEAPAALREFDRADSVALDPHKWLYVPIEAACTLTRDPEALRRAFGFRPPYYRLGDSSDVGGLDYFEHGLQNTRAFRALKVWLCLRQAGRSGYERSIRENIRLAAHLFARAKAHAEIEAGSHHLSIATLRFRPADLKGNDERNAYLDELNEQLVAAIQNGGAAHVSNAIIDGRYFLRACVVNFRTRQSDIDALVDLVVELGRNLDANRRRR